MPLGPGVRYRFRTLPSGKKQRLAFRGDRVVETKLYSARGQPLGDAEPVSAKKRRPLRMRKPA